MYATVFTVVMVLQFILLTVFHCSVFGMSWNVLGCLGIFLGCLGTSCTWFELRYDDDPMMELPRVMRKMAMPYENTLQLRIITCLFVACSWNLVLGLSGT